jgi:hypothetical protein
MADEKKKKLVVFYEGGMPQRRRLRRVPVMPSSRDTGDHGGPELPHLSRPKLTRDLIPKALKERVGHGTEHEAKVDCINRVRDKSRRVVGERWVRDDSVVCSGDF